MALLMSSLPCYAESCPGVKMSLLLAKYARAFT
jgi:hypothetical protein